jgi:hypothetical protein
MKLSDIRLSKFSPAKLTAIGIFLIVIAIPLVLTETWPQLTASIVGGNKSCTPNWQCSAWTDCVDNHQSRNCIDAKNCPGTSGMPAIAQACSAAATAMPTSSSPSDSGLIPVGQLANTNAAAGNNSAPVSSSTPSSSPAQPLPSKSLICLARCLTGQKNTLGEGNAAVYAIDCAGKATYCGIDPAARGNLCVSDASSAKCNSTTSQKDAKSPFVDRTIAAIFAISRQISQAVNDTFQSLLNL